MSKPKEAWNENTEKCTDCGIEWKKIGKPCRVCYSNNMTNKPKTNEEWIEDGLNGVLDMISDFLPDMFCENCKGSKIDSDDFRKWCEDCEDGGSPINFISIIKYECITAFNKALQAKDLEHKEEIQKIVDEMPTKEKCAYHACCAVDINRIEAYQTKLRKQFNLK